MNTILIPFKDRKIPYEKRVRVYRNLNAGKTEKVFSILHNGLVHAHGHSFILTDCNFIVKEAGRQRVIHEQRKNVHAYIEGILDESQPMMLLLNEIGYNPYKQGSFMLKTENKPISKCKYVFFDKNGNAYI